MPSLMHDLKCRHLWTNKGATKVVTVTEKFEELNFNENFKKNQRKGHQHKKIRESRKSLISYEFKIYDVLDNNYCFKLNKIQNHIQHIPNHIVECDRYTASEFNSFTLTVSECERFLVFFDGISQQLVIFQFEGGLSSDFKITHVMVQQIELIAKNDIVHDTKFAKVQLDAKYQIQVTFGY